MSREYFVSGLLPTFLSETGTRDVSYGTTQVAETISNAYTVNLTGISSALSAGSLSSSASGLLSGAALTMAQGALTPYIQGLLSGISSSVSLGTITTAGGTFQISLTGIGITSEQGSIYANISVPLSGIGNIFSLGALLPNHRVNLSGELVTAAQGGMIPANSLALTGQSTNSSQGSLSPQSTVMLTGAASMLSAGTLIPILSKALSGQPISPQQGSLLADFSFTLFGQAITSSTGTIIPGIGANVQLTGVEIGANQGALTPQLSKTLIGQLANVTQGILTPALTSALTGQSSTLALGPLIPRIKGILTSANLSLAQGQCSVALSVNLNGTQATLYVGTVYSGAGVDLDIDAVLIEFGSNRVLAATAGAEVLIAQAIKSVYVEARGSDTTPAETPAPPSSETTFIAVNSVTADNVINAVEAASTITISGTVTGTFTAGDAITVTSGATVYSATVAANGTWSVTASGTILAAGDTLLIALTATDAYGNNGVINATKSYTVDTVAPSAPSVDPSDGSLVSGTAEANATITLIVGVATYTTTADALGAWSRVFSPAIADATTVYVTATDAAGNVSDQSSIVVDSGAGDVTPPAAPIITDINGQASGSSTSDTTPTLNGTAEANSTITVYRDAVQVGTTTTNGSGIWTYTSAVLADGGYSFTATATDAANNTSSLSSAFIINVSTVVTTAIYPQLAVGKICTSGRKYNATLENILFLKQQHQSAKSNGDTTVAVVLYDNSVVSIALADLLTDITELMENYRSIVCYGLAGVSVTTSYQTDIYSTLSPGFTCASTNKYVATSENILFLRQQYDTALAIGSATLSIVDYTNNVVSVSQATLLQDIRELTQNLKNAVIYDYV